MKVKCVKLLNADGLEVATSAWLTLDKEYHVLEVISEKTRGISYRLLSDASPAIFLAQGFEIVSGKLPSLWQAEIASGALYLTTPVWSKVGFWERYFDDDPEAVRLFEEDREKIIREDP